MATAGADDGVDADGLSAFERERAERIRKNKEVMARLGLLDCDIVAAARHRSGAAAGGAAPARQKKSPAKKRKRVPSRLVPARLPRPRVAQRRRRR